MLMDTGPLGRTYPRPHLYPNEHEPLVRPSPDPESPAPYANKRPPLPQGSAPGRRGRLRNPL